jgi:hypothetical protein
MQMILCDLASITIFVPGAATFISYHTIGCWFGEYPTTPAHAISHTKAVEIVVRPIQSIFSCAIRKRIIV